MGEVQMRAGRSCDAAGFHADGGSRPCPRGDAVLAAEPVERA
jgi:hypothetical protein